MIPSRGVLFDGYFVWEKECSATIVELHQQHASTKIVELTQDNWFLIEACTTLLIPYRTKQTAVPPHHRVQVHGFHNYLRIT